MRRQQVIEFSFIDSLAFEFRRSIKNFKVGVGCQQHSEHLSWRYIVFELLLPVAFLLAAVLNSKSVTLTSRIIRSLRLLGRRYAAPMCSTLYLIGDFSVCRAFFLIAFLPTIANAEFFSDLRFDHIHGYDEQHIPQSNMMTFGLGVQSPYLLFYEAEFGVNGAELLFDGSTQKPFQYDSMINFVGGATLRLAEKIYVSGSGGYHVAFFDTVTCSFIDDDGTYSCDKDVANGTFAGLMFSYNSLVNGSIGLSYRRYFMDSYPTYESFAISIRSKF